jgi:hypothetical protein
VRTQYDIFFPPDVGHNSCDALQYTAQSIELYLEKGKFLRGDEPDTKVNVSTTHLYFTIGTMMTGVFEKHSTQSDWCFG